MINILFIASILTIVLLLVSIYISKLLEKKFSNYKIEIDNYIAYGQIDMLSDTYKCKSIELL